jgi:hypothetical protein
MYHDTMMITSSTTTAMIIVGTSQSIPVAIKFFILHSFIAKLQAIYLYYNTEKQEMQ